MGYGVPAAVAAKLLHPERDVVAIAGDGDFLMTGQELATAVQYDAPIVVLIVNNGMLGTIRMHQERHYPGRVSGTDLVNPDFAALAEAFGAHGAVVERTEDFAAAFDAALGAGSSRRDRAARRPRGADAAAVADRDSRAGDRAALDARRITRHALSTRPRRSSPDGKVVRKHGDQGIARRGLGARSRLQRPRHVAQRARLAERDRGRQGRRSGRCRFAASRSRTGPTSGSSCSRISDLERSYTYDFQKTPFDVDNYCATLRVTPLTDGGGSFVEWWTTFDCDRDRQGYWVDFFATRGVPGRLRRAEGALRLMGGARRELRVAGQAEPISHFTDAVEAGGFLFVSGIVPVDERRELVGGDDVVAQARWVFENMRAVLAAGGCTFADVVKVTVYLTDVNDRPLVNPVRQEVFGETRPASTLVEISALVIPGAKIEVECVALVPA